MTIQEVKDVVEYVNSEIREYISANDSETNDKIQKGFFTMEDFTESWLFDIKDS